MWERRLGNDLHIKSDVGFLDVILNVMNFFLNVLNKSNAPKVQLKDVCSNVDLLKFFKVLFFIGSRRVL